jgi:hypothetical protein
MSTRSVWTEGGHRRGEADVGFAIPPKTQLIYVSGRAVQIRLQ